ncbi:unnamed protein product [Meloidogyne enterolobii]|uniref:Uncharacterized protein n=1 Tax=Meloidogyne enterolobii TaxID=390850 RepID=A0ACB0YZX9_MELEN
MLHQLTTVFVWLAFFGLNAKNNFLTCSSTYFILIFIAWGYQNFKKIFRKNFRKIFQNLLSLAFYKKNFLAHTLEKINVFIFCYFAAVIPTRVSE